MKMGEFFVGEYSPIKKGTLIQLCAKDYYGYAEGFLSELSARSTANDMDLVGDEIYYSFWIPTDMLPETIQYLGSLDFTRYFIEEDKHAFLAAQLFNPVVG